MSKQPIELKRSSILGHIAESGIYGNLGAFIGAGFSKAVLESSEGCVALSWGELLEHVAIEFGIDFSSIKKEYISYPELASRLCELISTKDGISYDEALQSIV
jgi:hypothetical protein